MDALAVVMEQPERLALRRLDLIEPEAGDIVVAVEWSGISTGTERLFYSGRMPAFPGMGYPLVPGYESVGKVIAVGAQSGHDVGERVFVPGSRGFREARGLFGGAASKLVVAGARATPLGEGEGAEAVLLALAATAHHAVVRPGANLPELIVGHGVLGRLVARMIEALGGNPTIWERDAARRVSADGYPILAPEADPRRDYATICDVSGDPAILDALIPRLAPRGEIVLAGFYDKPLGFAFPPAFLREARIAIAAEWQPADLAATRALIREGRLSLDGLITHSEPAENAARAYHTAFSDQNCLKMILDWRATS